MSAESVGNLSAVAVEQAVEESTSELCDCSGVPLMEILSNSENRLYCIVLSAAVLLTFMVMTTILICKHRRIKKLEEHIEEYFEDFRKQRNSTMKNAHYPSLSRSVRSGHTTNSTRSKGKVPLNQGPSHHLYNRYSVSTKESTSPIVFDIRGGKERHSRKTSLNILEQESSPSKEEENENLDDDEDANVSESYSGENKEIQYLTAVPNEHLKLKNDHLKLKSASPSARAAKAAKIKFKSMSGKEQFKKTKANYRARDINVKYNELVKLPGHHQGSASLNNMWPDMDHRHVPSFASAVLDLNPPSSRQRQSQSRHEAYL